MNALVLVCGKVFDGVSETLTGPAEILVTDNRIAKIERSVERPPGARVIDLSERTVSPSFIDAHVHLTMDAANLALQTLESSAAKALKGLNIARDYMSYGFTTLRDLGSVDPEWRRSICATRSMPGLWKDRGSSSLRIFLSASAGHGDLRGFYASRWTLPVSAIADGVGSVRALVRREHTFGSDWIKTSNTGGYFSPGGDPARVTWFDDEMEALTSTAHQLGMAVRQPGPAADNPRRTGRSCLCYLAIPRRTPVWCRGCCCGRRTPRLQLSDLTQRWLRRRAQKGAGVPAATGVGGSFLETHLEWPIGRLWRTWRMFRESRTDPPKHGHFVLQSSSAETLTAAPPTAGSVNVRTIVLYCHHQ